MNIFVHGPFENQSVGRDFVRGFVRIFRASHALRKIVCGFLMVFAATCSRADGVVVFNEIMYHPTTNQASLEWVEIHNQMAVDVDLAGWSITGGITYTFSEGATVPGGGYLVVAMAPADLTAVTGITNVVGPFVGRLSNNGNTLNLRNRDHRPMDTLSYGVEGDWPVGPDGSGVSLAKRDEDSASSLASNWTVSSRVGGTPGRRNFPAQSFEVTNSTPILSTGSWRYEGSGTNPGTEWSSPAFDDSGWKAGQGLFQAGVVLLPLGDPQNLPTVFSSGISPDGLVQSPGSADAHYQLTLSAEGSPPPPVIAATVIENHPAWAANDSSSSWIGVVNPGTIDVAPGSYTYRTTFRLDGFSPTTALLRLNVAADNRLNDVLLNGVPCGISYAEFSSLSGEFTITNGFVPGLNTLDFLAGNDGDGPNPGGFRVKLSGMASRQLATNTVLPAARTTYYFRTKFNLDTAPRYAAVKLNAIVADGAVFYLNGTEVLRVNMPDGAISAASFASSNVLAPSYLGPFDLKSSALVKGTNVLAVEVHSAPVNDGVVFGADLSLSTTNNILPPPLAVAFNEFSSATNKNVWVELINYGSSSLDLSDCVLARQRSGTNSLEYVFPSQELAAGAMVQLSKTVLGFGADPGDRFFLYGPARENVLDAFVAQRDPRARWPDGMGQWLSPAELTPGSSNQFAFHDEIVINEIMYDAPPTAAGDIPAGWLELYNRSSNSVNLSGWRLSQDIDFAFTPETTIPAGGYLVVAKDAGYMRTNYPGISVVGPFEKNLGRSEGRIVLLDSNGNPADETHYFSTKPWPEYANGLGSSLELRDSWADNSKPEAWAASNEAGASVWTNCSYRMVASQILGPTLWNEFVVGLLDAGECLIDDFRVIESPSTTQVSFLQNGAFNAGITAWRFLGDHAQSHVETDPANPGNPVLHLIATGPTDHIHNHLETTFAGGRSVSNGKEYQISFRAKWLAGNNRLNTRLYFNRLAKTTALPMPSLHGTPGARNSTYATNIGPTFSGFGHSPIAPRSDESVSVSVGVSDRQGVSTVALCWSANGAAWKTTPMEAVARSAEPGYSNYVAIIPAQPAGTIVQFFVRAADNLDTVATYPAAGASSRALFKVQDGLAIMKQLHRFRLLMTPADASFLHQNTNAMSNARLGLTVVYDEKEVFYDAGVHLQSSERGRDDSSRAGFTVKLPAGRLLRGVVDNFTIDRSGGYSGRGGRHDEILLWHAVNHAGGLPGLQNDLVQCFAPRAQENGTGMLRMSAFDAKYFDGLFKNGGDGNQYKLELIYYPLTTVNGDPQLPKLPQPDDVINVETKNWGDDKENYRWIFRQENHADQDDYSQIIALNKAFSLTGAALDARMDQLMDVDEYMRALAFKAFTGDGDTYTYGYNHNWKFYFRPEDGKALGLLWDMDFSYYQSIDSPFPGSASTTTYNLVTRPTNYRIYYNHLLDILTTTVNANYLAPWGAHYGGLVGQNWSGAVSYLEQRANYIRSRMPPLVPFAITSNGGKDFSTSQGFVDLTGTASLTVKNILINGVAFPISWAGLTNWTLTVPLPMRTNVLTVQGFDNRGRPLTNAVDSITVTNISAADWRPVFINEWMADNSGPGGLLDLSDNLYSDWLELYNPNNIPVNLSGCYLTDSFAEPLKWRIPTNTVIGPSGFLFIWADKQTNLNFLGTNSVLHADFRLSKDGSELGLYGSDGSAWHKLVFGKQTNNVSQGLFPDGDTNAFYSMPAWTPGSANHLGAPQSPSLSAPGLSDSGSIAFSVSAIPGRTYRVEYKNELSDSQWTPLITNRVVTGSVFTVGDVLGQLPHRFYRVVIVP